MEHKLPSSIPSAKRLRDEAVRSKWQSIAKEITDRIAQAEASLQSDAIAEEAKLFEPETERFAQLRVALNNMWVNEGCPENSYDAIQACVCYQQGDCWYAGEMQRLDELQRYRLKGTEDTFLCDVCYGNEWHKRNCDDIVARLRTADCLRNLASKLPEVIAKTRARSAKDIPCAFGDDCLYRRSYVKFPDWCTDILYKHDSGRFVCDACADIHHHMPDEEKERENCSACYDIAESKPTLSKKPKSQADSE
jgi:hypothetical protein